MDKMIVVVFDTDTQAYEASRALQALNNEGSIVVYSGAVVEKSNDGTVQVRDAVDEGPIGTAIGMSVGTLIGALGGPAGVLAGAAIGGLTGMYADTYNVLVDGEFVQDVASQLENGKCALVAEINEVWTTPVDTRMEEIGGTVIRQSRIDVETGQWTREVEALEAEIQQLNTELEEAQAEYEAAVGEAKDKLAAKVEAAREKLDNAKDHAKSQLEAFKADTQAKIESLKESIKHSNEETKARLQQKIEEIQADYKVRSGKMKQAWTLTKEAFAVG